MQESLSFHCKQCGKCCKSNQSDEKVGYFIPLYLDEVDRLKELAKRKNLKIDIEPDLMYFDELNNQLIILTYAMKIDEKGCIFYQTECSIYEERPITCGAYPLSIYRVDDTTELSLKPECSFVEDNQCELRLLDYYDLGEVFTDEFPVAREIQIKGNTIREQIELLEKEGKIKIPVKLPVEITEEIETLVKVRLDVIK